MTAQMRFDSGHAFFLFKNCSRMRLVIGRVKFQSIMFYWVRSCPVDWVMSVIPDGFWSVLYDYCGIYWNVSASSARHGLRLASDSDERQLCLTSYNFDSNNHRSQNCWHVSYNRFRREWGSLRTSPSDRVAC